LPDGSEPLIPLQWQPLPGDGDARIYPFIRKVDTTSSNSFLVQTPDAVILIDPGGLPEQAAHLASLIREVQVDPALPLVVILTHAHVDHYGAVSSVPLLIDRQNAVLAIQEQGMRVVETADRRMTQAEVLGRDLTPLKIDLPLLAASPARGTLISSSRTFPNGLALVVEPGPPQYGLPHEMLILGNRTRIGVYHTPGHSPDSCCFRIGKVLFTGDLLFATSPGIAGISGWDQHALIQSLEGVRALLASEEIEVICSGHGLMLSAKDAGRTLDAVQKDAPRLTGISELDPERARQMAKFAEDSMEQVHELFTVLAGRLYYVSHVMEELEEAEIASGLDGLIRADVIDGMLDSFDAFNQEYHSGKYVPINLALKGGQVVGKLQRSFDQTQLGRILDPTLVQRAERLLSDYVAMLRGFNPPRRIVLQDLRELLQRCVTSHTLRPGSDEEVLASADDKVSFGQMLLSRIGTTPLLAEIPVTLDLGTEPLTAPVDPERFLDLVTYLLEDLVGCGAMALVIGARKERNEVLVTLSGERGESPICRGGPRRFLYGLCERTGGTLRYGDEGGSRRYEIGFTAVI
jgi:glyoxylase-like metal-dependent hydrolase (beta-lactamase superfamily II)